LEFAGEVHNVWLAKEGDLEMYEIEDLELAVDFVEQLSIVLQDESCPHEIRRLGCIVSNWSLRVINPH
jgi:hypothetical protein